MNPPKWFLLLALLGVVTLDAVSAQIELRKGKDKESDKDATMDADEEEEEDLILSGVAFEGDEEGDNMEALAGLGCPGLDFDADCDECLEAGCVISVGDCLAECSVADVSCWDMQWYPNATIADVCDRIETEEEDESICGDEEVQDCEVCTSTVKSDGESLCSWYDGGYCGTGDACDAQGFCPTESCDGVVADSANVTDTETDGVASVTDTMEEEEEEATTEEPPMEEEEEATEEPPMDEEEDEEPMEEEEEEEATTTAEPPMEEEATTTAAPPMEEPEEVVVEQPMAEPEEAAATAQPTEAADEVEMETAATVGPTEDATEGEDASGGDPCTGFDMCEPCLNSRIDCAWISNGCFQPNACTVLEEATCYHPSESGFAGMTGPEICAKAAEDALNANDPAVVSVQGEPGQNTVSAARGGASFLQTVALATALSAMLLSLKQQLLY